MQRKLLSNEQRSHVKLFFFFLLVSVIFRAVFYFTFKGTDELSYTNSSLLKALYIGFKFDVRASVILSSLVWFLGTVFKFVNWFFEDKSKSFFTPPKPYSTRILQWLYAFILTLYTVLYIFDLGNYDYLKNRLDSSSTVFLKNPLISLQMISETYPVFLVFIAVCILFFVYLLVLKKIIINKKIFETNTPFFQSSWKVSFSLFFLFAGLGHGKASQYPLRWSEAYFSPNSFVSALALNPLLYFYDTLKFKEKGYNLDKVREHYDTVSSYLGVEHPNKETLNFSRTIKPFMAFDKKPNVVIIMMESLAAFKMKHFGQEIEGTPFLDSLVPKSLFFDNFYVTSTGTARSIFGVLTGLPDINSVKTASRNPFLVHQYSAANGFSDYEKTYFIGGSANWGNIRGFVGKSLKGVTLLEEDDFKSKKNDVWGVSDLMLFKEANSFLKTKDLNKPQFTFIQTAGYHRPYTIPKEKGDFELKQLTEKQIQDYGFVSNEEYNSLRFSDYALKEFFKAAEKEEYFKNTLFVIYADHGLSHFASKTVSKGFKRFKLPVMHVPLLFYSPALKSTSQVFHKVAYQPDVIPSILSLTGHTYVNKTLGRNLFDTSYDNKRFAMTVTRFATPLVLRLHDRRWISEGSSNGVKGLYPYTNDKIFNQDESALYPDEMEFRKNLSEGLYETTKYLYHHSVK